MKYLSLKLTLLIALVICYSSGLVAQEKDDSAGEGLRPFEQLIGGEWHLGNSYQVFEWGVGKLSVNSRNFFVVDGSPKLVAEGSWFWHPGENKIKGNFSAIQMPAVLFEYVTRFEDNKMINELSTYTADGKREDYTEIWEFVDAERFKWTLYSNSVPEPTKIMEGTYLRKLKKD